MAQSYNIPEIHIAIGKCMASQGEGPTFSQALENKITTLNGWLVNAQDRLQVRTDIILSGRELNLKVEGKDTNLRIWVSKDKEIGMRLDCYQQYSAPLSVETASRLDEDNPIVKQLAEHYGFASHIDKLEAILKLTLDMPVRQCKPW